MHITIRILIIAALIPLFSSTGNAQDRWTPIGGNFRACQKLADGRVCIATSEGYLLWSVDDGVSWTPQVLDTASGLNSIAFVGQNQNIGFAVSDSNRIFRTTDHGSHWSANELPVTTGLSAISAPCDDTLYACGNAGALVRSIDGGISWQTKGVPTFANLHKLFFTSSMHGYITADSGVLLETRNAGETWNSIPVPFAKSQSISMFNVSQNGKLVAASEWEVGVSSDDGATWTTNRIDKNVIAQFNLGKFVGEDTLVVLQAVNLFIYYSTNAGATWDSTYLNRSGDYSDSWMSSGGKLVIIGNSGLVWSIDVPNLIGSSNTGDILHTAPGGGIRRDPVPGESNHIHAVDAGSRGLNSTGVMFFTSDGGYSWMAHSQPKDYDGYIGLKFTSDSDGIIIPPQGTNSLNTSFHPSFTTDNGVIWTKLGSSHMVAGPWSGCAEGSDGSLFLYDDTAICYSTDNGMNWSRWASCWVEPDTDAIPQLEILEGKFWGQDTAYLHIYDGGGTLAINTLAKTTDRGANWQTSAIAFASSSGNQVSFIDPKIGLASCGNGGVLRTTDGGETWSQPIVGIPNRNWIGSVFNQSGSIGILLSHAETASYDDTVFVTFDSGISYQTEFVPTFGSPPSNGIISAAFTDDTTSFIQNESVVYRRTFHLPIGTPNEIVQSTASLITVPLTVFPSPAEFQISVEPFESGITITDVLGNVYDCARTANTLDISSLPSGVYFVSDGRSRSKFVKE